MNRRHEHHGAGCLRGSGRFVDGRVRGYGSGFSRHFETKEEKIQGLENYLKDLKLETQAVEETLTDLRK
jgi:hypothetical protein